MFGRMKLISFLSLALFAGSSLAQEQENTETGETLEKRGHFHQWRYPYPYQYQQIRYPKVKRSDDEELEHFEKRQYGQYGGYGYPQLPRVMQPGPARPIAPLPNPMPFAPPPVLPPVAPVVQGPLLGAGGPMLQRPMVPPMMPPMVAGKGFGMGMAYQGRVFKREDEADLEKRGYGHQFVQRPMPFIQRPFW
jgi:hypothetical protein